jgi:hypothetical protein
MAWNISLRDAILRLAVDSTRQFYLRRLALVNAKLAKRAKVGGLSVEHRFDSALKIDDHWPLQHADDVFYRTRAGQDAPARVKFLSSGPHNPHDVPEVLAHDEARVMKLLQRRKMLAETPDGQPPPEEFARKHPAMATVMESSLSDRSVPNPARSVPLSRERRGLPDDVKPQGKNCTSCNPFTLHANRYIAPLERQGLEQMIRYLCRPALATRRVELLEHDEVVRLGLKTQWRDGPTHLRLPTSEFMMRLLSLLPVPRKQHLRYLSVFGANAAWRREVVPRPKPPKGKPEHADACGHAARAPADERLPGHALSRLSWHLAMRRRFKIDAPQCLCGGRREVIGLLPSGEVATKILAHMRLPVTTEGYLPIRAPPWDDDLGWAAANDAVDLPFFDEAAA